jgi:hypothetical protein
MWIGRIRLIDTHHAHSSLNLTQRLVTALAPPPVLRTGHTLRSLNSVSTLTSDSHPLVLPYFYVRFPPPIYDQMVIFPGLLLLGSHHHLFLHPIAEVEVNIVHIRLVAFFHPQVLRACINHDVHYCM